MTTGPIILLVGFLLLISAAGAWVIRLHRSQPSTPAPIALAPGRNHHTVGKFHYLLSDYLDQEKQLRDKLHAQEHAQRIERLLHYEQYTQHQTELAAEQARSEAAWETSKDAIAEWLAQQQQAAATLNPPPPPPPAAPDFKDASLSPAKRRKALFQQLTATSEAVVI